MCGMNLLRHLLKPQPRPSAADVPVTPAADEPPPHCGWFDSSHDLKHGLEVVEMTWPDTLPFAWPLDAVASSTQRG